MTIALSITEHNQKTINQAIRETQNGRDNASGSVTLTANVGTTTVAAVNCSPTSGVQLTPATANAATAVATTYVSTVGKGQFVITHANNAQVDRTFYYRVHGGN